MGLQQYGALEVQAWGSSGMGLLRYGQRHGTPAAWDSPDRGRRWLFWSAHPCHRGPVWSGPALMRWSRSRSRSRCSTDLT